MEIPNVRVGEQIKIGNHFGAPKAQIIRVYSEEEKNALLSGDIEVAYLQNGLKNIKEDAVWDGDVWKFKNDGPGGSYVR